MALYIKPFMQLVEDTMDEMREKAHTDAAVERKYKRRVNDVYMFDIPNNFEFDWLRNTENITLLGKYSTGTVAVDSGDTTVTGTSTVWTSSHSDYKMHIGSNNEIYVFTYVSATSGTISPAFTGTSDETAATYVLYQDTYSLASDYLRPTTHPGFYYYVVGAPFELKWKSDEEFIKGYTYQDAMYPSGWREKLGRTSAGLYRVEIMNPVTNDMILRNEYIRAQAEMYEATDTAATGSTTTKVLTTIDIASKISIGQYFRVDDDYQWVKITAVASNTTTGNGITVDTLRTAPDNADAITICDAPNMPPSTHIALFYGACARTDLDQGKSTSMYTKLFLNSLGEDKAVMARKRYGMKYMQRVGIRR